jgi:hypothetical protein
MGAISGAPPEDGVSHLWSAAEPPVVASPCGREAKSHEGGDGDQCGGEEETAAEAGG